MYYHDPVKMEQALKVVSLLEVLSNPDEFKSMLQAMDAKLKELKELTGAYDSIKKAEAYVAKLEDEIDDEKDAFAKEKAAIEEGFAKREADLKADRLAVEALRAKAVKLSEDAEAAAKAVDKAEKAVSAREAEVKNQSEANALRAQELAAKENALQAKSNALAELLK